MDYVTTLIFLSLEEKMSKCISVRSVDLSDQFRGDDTSYSDDCACPDLSVTTGQGQKCKEVVSSFDLVRVVDKYHACPPTFNFTNPSTSAIQEWN